MMNRSPQKKNTCVLTDKYIVNNLKEFLNVLIPHPRILTVDKPNYNQPALKYDSSHCN